MTDDFLKDLAAGPLADPNKVFLPRGRKKGQRKRTPDELELFRAERDAKKARGDRDLADHRDALLSYYATTDVPIARVAEHLGIGLVEALEGLKRHGREPPA